MTRLLCQPMGGQAPFRWLRHPIVGEPVGALPPEGWGFVIVRCRGSPGTPQGWDWTTGRGKRSYLVFGDPPCGTGSCRVSWRKTHSSRLCEGGRQNEQVEGDGRKEEDTQIQKSKTGQNT